MATRNNKRNAQENKFAAQQQVSNTQAQASAPATQGHDAPVPASVEQVEANFEAAKKALSKAKKTRQNASAKVQTLKERFDNEQYALAMIHVTLGTADETDAVTISTRRVENGLSDALTKAMAALPTDSDEVATLKASAKAEERSLSSAIAETKRQWNSTYRALYATVGITKQTQLKPELLKGISPYLQVGTADGLKAAVVGRSAVRKNGKAVKQNGKRVYKYTLRERKGWTAFGLFETIELNFRWQQTGVFTDEELATRQALLDKQVSALKALKAAKEAKNSDVPEQAQDAEGREKALADAAKAAGNAAKENATNVVSKTA